MSAVAVRHQLDDVRVHLLGRPRDTEVVGEVGGPFLRAHAHHRPLRLFVIASAEAHDVVAAYLVPDLLRLDQHAVEVEDDSLDQRQSRHLRSLVSSAESTLTTTEIPTLRGRAAVRSRRARPRAPRRRTAGDRLQDARPPAGTRANRSRQRAAARRRRLRGWRYRARAQSAVRRARSAAPASPGPARAG